MTTKMLLFNLMFPLGSILHWAYIRFSACKKSTIAIEDGTIQVVARNYEEYNSDKELLKNSLEVIVGPFRETKTNSSKKLSWESALITRRLTLISIKTFIMNTLIKLLVMLLFTVLFVVHHATVQPFSKPVLNHVETCSLVMLTIICVLNVIPAYNYAYSLSASPFSETVIKIFLHIETALSLIFPAMIGVCVLLLLFIRFLELIVWIGRIIVKTIYLCMRRTFSRFNSTKGGRSVTKITCVLQ